MSRSIVGLFLLAFALPCFAVNVSDLQRSYVSMASIPDLDLEMILGTAEAKTLFTSPEVANAKALNFSNQNSPEDVQKIMRVLIQPENACQAKMLMSLSSHLVKFFPKMEKLLDLKSKEHQINRADTRARMRFVMLLSGDRVNTLASAPIMAFGINGQKYSQENIYPRWVYYPATKTHAHEGKPYHWPFENDFWYKDAFQNALTKAGFSADENVEPCTLSNAQFTYLLGVNHRDVEAGIL